MHEWRKLTALCFQLHANVDRLCCLLHATAAAAVHRLLVSGGLAGTLAARPTGTPTNNDCGSDMISEAEARLQIYRYSSHEWPWLHMALAIWPHGCPDARPFRLASPHLKDSRLAKRNERDRLRFPCDPCAISPCSCDADVVFARGPCAASASRPSCLTRLGMSPTSSVAMDRASHQSGWEVDVIMNT